MRKGLAASSEQGGIELAAGAIVLIQLERVLPISELELRVLFDAIARAIRADAAVFALVVDAKDEAAARFYRHHAFEAFSGRAARMFLPVATAGGWWRGERLQPIAVGRMSVATSGATRAQ
jgi:hypothetical protein